MNDGFSDEDAALAALGMVDADMWPTVVSRRLEEPGFAAAMDGWSARLAPLALALAPLAPPADLWRRIEARIDAEPALGSGSETRAMDGAGWNVIAPGIEKRVLSGDGRTAPTSFLLRFAAGATLAGHDHAAGEECVMIAGEMTIAGMRLTVGDWHRMPRASRHAEITSDCGAVVFIRKG
jgi:hypothetical protein